MVKEQKYISDEMSKKIISTVKDLAKTKGANSITVSDVLRELNISNRVFYNRFNNIEEVLQLIYIEITDSFHQNFDLGFDSAEDFFENLINYMENTLIGSYNTKGNLNQFIFERDSVSSKNFDWWIEEIKRIINFAIEEGYIRDINIDQLSYAIWCFIRGFNADALSRDIPLEESREAFRYSFKLFLDGLQPND